MISRVRTSVLAIAFACFLLTICCALPFAFAEPSDAASDESTETTNEQASDSANSASSSSSSDASSSKSSTSASSASASSSAAASPFTLFTSPDLLSQKKSESAASSLDAATTNTEFDYKGTYNGLLTANGDLAEAYWKTLESSVVDQVCALAENGGVLILTDGKIIKLGDATDSALARSYGLNATSLSLGSGTNMLLSKMIVESAAVGATGIFAASGGSVYANDVTVLTNKEDSALTRATYGGTLRANDIHGESRQKNSPALVADGSESAISITNSSFETESARSPFFRGTGRLEADNVIGTTGASPLAVIMGQATVQLSGSRLSSTALASDAENEDADNPCAIMMYRPSKTEGIDSKQPAVFQAVDSVISTTIQSGSLFYLTNTRSQIILSNTQLDFDNDNTKLLVAEGNNTHDWGVSGENGGTCSFAAYNQNLNGEIEVDSLSNVGVYLMEESQWIGSSSIHTNNGSTSLAENLTVNIDSSSSWVVTEDSTVTNINLDPGGKLIDTKGRSVKLVDSNGFTLVDGASDISVVVNGNFSMMVNTAAAPTLHESTIDRSIFDETFGVETEIGSNGSSALTEEEQKVIELINAVKAWFARL